MGLMAVIAGALAGMGAALAIVAIRRAWSRAQTIRYYEKFFDGDTE